MMNRDAENLRKPGDFALDPAVLAANLVVGFDPTNQGAHPFLIMRSHLLKHARTTGQRVFAMTSVQSGDGKTHVALNLAAALSRVHPTVLVELDMRWPTVRHRLGLPGVAGIDDYLKEDVDADGMRLPIAGFDLSILSVRRRRLDAEVLLGSPRLDDLFDDLREAQGAPICIVDCPPALANDDLTLILGIVDAVLIVVREARTRKRALMEALGAISPTPVAGSILNLSASSAQAAPDYSYYQRTTDD